MTIAQKRFVVFELTDAFDGISHDGYEYHDFKYTLYKHKGFDSEQECEMYIAERLLDLKTRNFKNNRFVIMPVYFLNEDEIFDR
jgi:hypothetical protein